MKLFDRHEKHRVATPENQVILKSAHPHKHSNEEVKSDCIENYRHNLPKLFKESASIPISPPIFTQEITREMRAKLDELVRIASAQEAAIPQIEQMASSPEQKPKDSITVYFSYAREDQRLQQLLKSHLQPMKYNHTIKWQDGEIPAGKAWEAEMKKLVTNADVILLLLSANSLNSYAQIGIEMMIALERSKEALVIPVIIYSCAWEDTPLNKFIVLPRSGKPVAEQSKRQKAFFDVAREIQKAINDNLICS